MKIEQVLTKHRIKKKDFMEYAGFVTRSGFNRALANKARRIRIRHSLTCYLIEVRCNIDTKLLLEAIKEDD